MVESFHAERSGTSTCLSDPSFSQTGLLNYSSAKSVCEDATHFSDAGLLRGSSLSNVLHCFGAIFANSAGDARTYGLSESVTRIDAFLSHNWSTPRWQKFVSLAMYFNRFPALILAIVFAILASVLTGVGLLPTFMSTINRKDLIPELSSYKDGPWGVLFGTTGLLFGLFLSHESMLSMNLHKGRRIFCFLDKTCIHQTDKQKMLAGIASLAAFLGASECLAIMYADTYFHKLWTVYEIASYLTMCPGRPIIMMPVLLPKYVLAVTAIQTICNILNKLTRFHSLGALQRHTTMWSLIINMPWILVTTVAMRKWSRARAEMYESVAKFKIENAKCFVESDRALVHRNVEAFMRVSGHVDLEASDAEVLEAFDSMVRNQCPQILSASLGRAGLPYRYTLLMFSFFLYGCCDILVWFCVAQPPGYPLLVMDTLLERSTWCFAVYPIFVAILAFCTRHFLSLPYYQNIMFQLIVACAMHILVSKFHTMWRFFTGRVHGPDFPHNSHWLERTILFAFMGASFAVTIVLYWPVTIRTPAAVAPRQQSLEMEAFPTWTLSDN